MDTQELLTSVTEAARLHAISKAELIEAYEAGSTEKTFQARRLDLATLLYYLGGAIVFLGIAVLLSQNWEHLNKVTQLLVTLGVAIVCYISAWIFTQYEEYSGAANPLFLISALLLPTGLYVLLHVVGIDISPAWVSVSIFAITFCMFLFSYLYFKRIILLLFSIIFGTFLVHSIVQWIVGNNLTADTALQVYEYEMLSIGLGYMVLGRYYSQIENRSLVGVLYGFGSILFLLAGILLGGYYPHQHIVWELAYPLLVFGIIFLSIYIKSKSFLVFGTLFLISYILKLTGEYFSNGFGWSLSLVIAGLVIMVVGYYAVKINKKYLVPNGK